jgi:stage III sporulation protein SpoIIIAA
MFLAVHLIVCAQSVLVVGDFSTGKTCLLRDVARRMADDKVAVWWLFVCSAVVVFCCCFFCWFVVVVQITR